MRVTGLKSKLPVSGARRSKQMAPDKTRGVAGLKSKLSTVGLAGLNKWPRENKGGLGTKLKIAASRILPELSSSALSLSLLIHLKKEKIGFKS
jgi:hypothetical protein